MTVRPSIGARFGSLVHVAACAVAATLVVGALRGRVASGAPLVHVALRASSPAADDTLTAPPRVIRLEFTQAVEPRLARFTLSAAGTDSAVIPLAPVHAADSTSTALVAEPLSPLGAGTYRVRWNVTSRDSHTIRGEFGFTVTTPAVDTVPSASRVRGDSAAPASVPPDQADAGTEFGAQSPVYLLIRWLAYIGMLGVIGAFFFRVGVVRPFRQQAGADPAANAMAARALAAARVGAIGAAAVLLVSAALRLAAQVRAVLGDSSMDQAMMSALVGGTAWGWGWMTQVAAAVVALGVALMRPRGSDAGKGIEIRDVVAGIAVLALGVSAAMSGHPAAASPAMLAIALDAAHGIAAGGWIGSLAYVAFAGIPAAAIVDADSRPRLVRQQVTTFSAVALTCVAVILLTGLAASWMQMRSVSALWATPYGRTLLIKLAFVALVAAAGAYNWRVATPRLTDLAGVSRIRRVMVTELLLAVLVLGATATLVATPPPVDAMGDAVP